MKPHFSRRRSLWNRIRSASNLESVQCHPALAAVKTCNSDFTESSLGPSEALGLVGSKHAKYKGLGNSLTARGDPGREEMPNLFFVQAELPRSLIHSGSVIKGALG